MSTRWVDLHNHVIPAVDDGARDLDDARLALAAMAEEGITTVVATPHVDGSLTADPPRLAARLAELDAGWDVLRDGGDAPVELLRGVELKLDLPDVDLSDPRLRLGGGRAVLVEFPFMSVPPRSAQALSAIRRDGYVPVLAHPERYAGLDDGLRVVAAWLDAGAVLQVNGASLTGRYGPEARAAALEMLDRGWVSCLASDYHCRGMPRVAEARTLLEAWGAGEQARLLFGTNPDRLLRDEPCIPVAPARPPGLVKRVFGRLLS